MGRGFNLSRERKKLPRFCQNATPGGKQFLPQTAGFFQIVLHFCNTALQQQAFFGHTGVLSNGTASYDTKLNKFLGICTIDLTPKQPVDGKD
jgi:hypothetical protein